jgi:hypothetical protein
MLETLIRVERVTEAGRSARAGRLNYKEESLRRILTILAATLVVALLAPTALAANVHWKRQPTFTDNGTTLTISGALAGLGNKDVTIKVVATGVATDITCRNKGGNEAPGQNRPRVQSLGDIEISSNEIKNGNVSFRFTTNDPAQLTARQAGCPNNNWKATINDVSFDSVTVTVIQNDEVVLRDTFDI